jgi:hypothetical protein
LEGQIAEAIAWFDYPPVTYDFIAGCELSFPSMIDLDTLSDTAQRQHARKEPVIAWELQG